eukprot:11822927-Alexandrium_andersonii.AAC.1
MGTNTSWSFLRLCGALPRPGLLLLPGKATAPRLPEKAPLARARVAFWGVGVPGGSSLPGE